MWAYDFLLAEPTARKLSTHLKANNPFLRWWCRETYLPEDMQLDPIYRFSRLLLTLSVYIVVVCFFLRKDSTYSRECDFRNVCLQACIDENFPELPCTRRPNEYIMYGKNNYTDLYEWRKKEGNIEYDAAFQECRNRIPPRDATAETYASELYDGRQPRTHVCFESCSPALEEGDTTSLYSRTWDSRPREDSDLCTKTNSTLLCVDPRPPTELCETTKYENEICLDKDTKYVCFQFTLVFLSCLVSIPILLVLDWVLIFILFVRPESIQDFGDNATKCGAQLVYCILCIATLLFLTSSVYLSHSRSRPSLMWPTSALVVIFDQLRNVSAQSFTWYFLLRRCGQVPIGEEEEAIEVEQGMTFLGVLQNLIKMLVESRKFDLCAWIFVAAYAVFTISIMSTEISSTGLSCEVKEILMWIDTGLLVAFLLELNLRLIATGIGHLFELWNFLDATIVIISFVMNIKRATGDEAANEYDTCESSSGLALLRLLRLLRLILVLRKVSAEDKLPNRSDGGLQFSSPVARVLEIFREIKEIKLLSPALKEQVDWAQDVISSNKLYSISIDLDKLKSGEGYLDQEVGDWVRLACDNAGEKSSCREIELEKLLSGRAKKTTREELINQATECVDDEISEAVDKHMESGRLNDVIKDLYSVGIGSGEIAVNSMMSGSASLNSVSGMLGRAHAPSEFLNLSRELTLGILEYLDEYIDKWEFDLHLFERLVSEKALTLVLMHACVKKDLYTPFDIVPDSLREFSTLIEQGYVRKNPYHNSTHAADVVQAFNVIFHWFETSHSDPTDPNSKPNCVLQEQELLSGLLAASIHDFEHPGLNNNYIIRTKHPMSIRYNDISVLENHHVSAGFIAMMSVEPDPLGHCTEAQYREIRSMIISMVLSTDMAHHFVELSAFKNKLNTKGFPTSKSEDKQILLNIMLHSSDISNPTRLLHIYLKWVPRVMEEFFRQGDLEKTNGMQVSMFYDRYNTSIPECQKGFIEVLILPTYCVLGQIIPQIAEKLLPTLDTNLKYFAAQGERGDTSPKTHRRVTGLRSSVIRLASWGANIKKMGENIGEAMEAKRISTKAFLFGTGK